MKTKKSLILLASLAIILLVSVGATLAFLVDKSGPVENTFVPGSVAVEVQESFDNVTKTGVKIKNTGNVDAYIRVAIIPTWEDDEGNPVGVSASLADLTIDWGEKGGSGTEAEPGNGWVKGTDGFWYYTSPVAPQDPTNILIDSATVNTPNGYHMNLQILAQSIQAEGQDSKGNKPIELAWGVDIDNGKLKSASINN